jgi:hypothetical protein
MAVLNPITLTFSQGDDVSVPLQFFEPDNITPTNKSGCTYQGFIRDTYDGDIIATWVIQLTNLSIGKITLTLPNSVTSQIDVPLARKIFVFDIEETNAQGKKQKVLGDKVQVLREATR